MGTIVYEYRNRIVELENESEQKEMRVMRIRIAAASAFVTMLLLLNTALFSDMNVLNKATTALGMGLLVLTVYEMTKEDHDSQKIRTLMFTGAAFLTTSLFAMAM